MEFTFHPETQMYEITSGRHKGEFYNQNDLMEILNAHSNQQSQFLEELLTDLFAGSLSLAAFETEFSQLLKDATIQSYKISNPNPIQETHRNSLAGMLQFQFGRLRSFLVEVQNGFVKTEAAFRSRAKLYLRKSYEAFERGKGVAHRLAGYVWEQRILIPGDSCQSCIRYADRGIVPIGTLPPPTVDCECRANCRCYKVYFRDNPSRQEMSQASGFMRRVLG